MTQTNTDYLFQYTAPSADRLFGAARSTNDHDAFDDHLSQAATNAGGGAPTFGGAAPKTNTQFGDRHADSGAFRDDSAPVAKSPATQTNNPANPAPGKQPAPQQDTPAKTSNSSKASADGAQTDDRDVEHPDDNLLVEAAAAGQTAQDHALQANAKSTNTNVATLSSAAKVKLPNEKPAAQPAPRSATDPHSAQLTEQGADSSGKLETPSAVLETATDIAVMADVSEQSQDPQAATSQSPQQKTGAARTKSKTPTDASNREASPDDPAATAGNTGVQAGASGNSVNQALVGAETIIANTSIRTTSADKSPDEKDHHRDTANNARIDTKNDATAQANKTNATLITGGALSGGPDNSPSEPSKGGDDQQAIKPITAKGEPTAIAFARLSRANAGTNDISHTANTDDGPRVDPARFIGRVAKAFQTANERGGTLQLRLSPPELGSLRLELTVKDGVMSASLQTENANARRLLLEHLPDLRDRLAQQNIRVDRFDVDVRRDGSGSQADARGSQQQFQHQPDQSSPRRQAPIVPRQQETAPQEITPATPIVSDAGLNLII